MEVPPVSFGRYIVWRLYRLGVRRTDGRSTHPDNRLALLPWPIQDFVIGKRHGAPSSRHVIPGARMIDSPVTPTSSCRRRPGYPRLILAATKASRGYRPEPVPAKAGAGMTRWAKRRWVNLEGVWHNDRHSVPKANIEAHDRRHPRCRRQIAQAAPLSGPTATFLPAIHLAIPHSIPSGVMVQNRDLRCSHANRVVMFGRRSLGQIGRAHV